MAVAVTISYGAAAGTTPPVLVNNGFAVQSDDDSGTVQLGSGTSPTSGIFCTITLGGNYSSGVDGSSWLRPEVWSINGAAAGLGLYVSAWNSRTITVSCTTSPAAGQAGTVYQFGYRT